MNLTSSFRTGRFQSPLGDFLYCQNETQTSGICRFGHVSVPVRGFFILSVKRDVVVGAYQSLFQSPLGDFLYCQINRVIPDDHLVQDVSVPVRGFFILSEVGNLSTKYIDSLVSVPVRGFFILSGTKPNSSSIPPSTSFSPR